MRDRCLGERRSKNEYPPHTFQAGTLLVKGAYPWSARHTGDPPNLDLYALKCTGTTGVSWWRFRWQPRGKRVAASKMRVVQAAYPCRGKYSCHLYLRGDTLFKPPGASYAIRSLTLTRTGNTRRTPSALERWRTPHEHRKPASTAIPPQRPIKETSPTG